MQRCPRPGERAFTLIEVLAATALWIVLGGAMLYVTQLLLAATRGAAAQQHAYVGLAHLLETWDAESSSALAIFVPPKDVLGAGNPDGHELDFYSRDAAHYGHFWAYLWDRKANTLQRYTYAAPGAQSAPSDPPLSGIVAFSARRKLASSVSQPFTNGYAPRDVSVNFGYPGVDGGSAITSVTVGDKDRTYVAELLPGTMTSGFSVVVATFTPAPAPSSTSTSLATSTPAPAPTPALVSASWVLDYVSTGCEDSCGIVLYSVWSCIGAFSDGSQQDLFDAVNNDPSQPPNNPLPPTDPANPTPPQETCPPS